MSRLSIFSGRPELSFRHSFVGFFGIFALTFHGAIASLRAEDMPSSSIAHEVRSIFERSAKAVVKIRASDQHGDLSGTGFFVDPTGTIYTSYSVGGDATNFTVEMEGKKLPARQVLVDLRSGLAMLKVTSTRPRLLCQSVIRTNWKWLHLS